MSKPFSVILKTCCHKLCVLLCATTIAFPPPVWGMVRIGLLAAPGEEEPSPVYESQTIFCVEEGGNLATPPQHPTDTSPRTGLPYNANTQPLRENLGDMGDQVAHPERWPYSVFCHVESCSAGGELFSGSGVMVGPQHFLTAAHCVYDARMGGKARSLTVHPALNDRMAPFGAIRGMEAYVYKEWEDFAKPELDIALVVLEKAIGHATGWAGMLAASGCDFFLNEKGYITGYATGDPSKKMRTVEDQIEIWNELFLIDASSSLSGGGIWMKELTGGPVVVGVHTSPPPFGGRDKGVRLSKQKFQDIVGWMNRTWKTTAPQAALFPVNRLPFASASTSSSFAPAPAAAAPFPVNRLPFASAFPSPSSFAPAAAAPSFTAVAKVPRPLSDDIPIPDIARGHEEVYRRFLGGKLIYRPNGDRDDRGMITLKVADLPNPLEGTFDLSRCGDTGEYLSIRTGYSRRKIFFTTENKVEIWFTPWFLVNAVKDTLPQDHYLRTVTTSDKWDPARAPVGIFWTRTSWDDLSYADYLTTQNMDDLSSKNLYINGRSARHVGRLPPLELPPHGGGAGGGLDGNRQYLPQKATEFVSQMTPRFVYEL